VVKFTPRYTLNKRLDGLQSRCDLFADKEETLDHTGFRTQDPRTRSSAVIPTEPLRLLSKVLQSLTRTIEFFRRKTTCCLQTSAFAKRRSDHNWNSRYIKILLLETAACPMGIHSPTNIPPISFSVKRPLQTTAYFACIRHAPGYICFCISQRFTNNISAKLTLRQFSDWKGFCFFQ
jgi:hypothetical protein